MRTAESPHADKPFVWLKATGQQLVQLPEHLLFHLFRPARSELCFKSYEILIWFPSCESVAWFHFPKDDLYVLGWRTGGLTVYVGHCRRKLLLCLSCECATVGKTVDRHHKPTVAACGSRSCFTYTRLRGQKHRDVANRRYIASKDCVRICLLASKPDVRSTLVIAWSNASLMHQCRRILDDPVTSKQSLSVGHECVFSAFYILLHCNIVWFRCC